MTTPATPRPSILDLVGRPGAQRVPRTIFPPNPAAGAQLALNVDAGVVWIVESIAITLTASAAVANRRMSVNVVENAQTIARTGATAVVTNGQVVLFAWSRNFGILTNASNSSGIASSLWDLTLVPGHSIVTTSDNFDVADQYSAIAVKVIELRPALDAKVSTIDVDAPVPAYP